MDFAAWIANRMYYQIRSTFTILSDTEAMTQLDSLTQNNVLILGAGTNNMLYSLLNASCVTFYGKYIYLGGSVFTSNLTGIVFNTMWGTERVAVVVDGLSAQGFQNAASLLPIKSGTTVPDYVVTGPKFGYSGAAGFSTLGFWDSNWLFQPYQSYVDQFANFY